MQSGLVRSCPVRFCRRPSGSKAFRSWLQGSLWRIRSPPTSFVSFPSILDILQILLAMSTSKPSNESLINLLEAEMKAFGDHPCPLLSWQLEAFHAYRTILEEDDASFALRSKQRRSELGRVRDLLTDIFVGLGIEVFLLCILAIQPSKLAPIRPRAFIPLLRRWWSVSSPPRGLTLTAKEICETYAVDAVVSSLRSSKISKIGPVSGTAYV